MSRPRLRDLGYAVGDLPTGARNAITDVTGVRVGHVTLVEDLAGGHAIRTGVTAVLPHDGDLVGDKAVAASFVLNGHGKTTGLVQVDELGTLESPVMLTNTLSVGAVTEGTIRWLLASRPELRSVNVVVGECNDGGLNDIRGLHVRHEHAIAAIETAGVDVAEGGIGAGTGMTCFGWKGGIGTGSRAAVDVTVGVLVLANFGAQPDLALHGWLHPSGAQRQVRQVRDGEVRQVREDREVRQVRQGPSAQERSNDGSCIVVVATDADVDARQLRRIAVRASLGIARAGGHAANGSGDLVIAFGKRRSRLGALIADDSPSMDALFRGAVEATHEAILNALCVAEAMTGDGGRSREAFPTERLARS